MLHRRLRRGGKAIRRGIFILPAPPPRGFQLAACTKAGKRRERAKILNDAEMGLSLPTRLEVGDNSCRGATVLPAASLPGLLPADSVGLIHCSRVLPSVPKVGNKTIKASVVGQANAHISLMGGDAQGDTPRVPSQPQQQ